MALTSIKGDIARIEKELQQSTGSGRYVLNMPGPGTNMPFHNDPHIRLQKWGANFNPNMIHLENKLRRADRPLNRDEVKYTYEKIEQGDLPYSSINMMTDQSRATHPAWSFLDQNIERWEEPLHDYQSKSIIQFANNVSSRIQQKNIFEKNLDNR
mgnify:FL=1